MRKTVFILAFAALVWVAPANAHLTMHRKCDTLRCQEKAQTANLAHAKGVVSFAKKHHIRNKEVWWHRKAVRWLSRELRETKAALRPKAVSYGGSNVALGQRLAARYGWHVGYEWSALYQLWNHESGWDEHAQNPSGACGIPQSMYSCFGYNPWRQIMWGLAYIRRSYTSPSRALAHWAAFNWY